MARPRTKPPASTARPQLRNARTTREAFERLEQDFRRRAEALAEGLASGRVDLDAWQGAMQTELRRYHLATSVLGAGGPSQVRAETYRIAEQRAAEQIGYLNRWADEMRRGTFPLDAAPRVRQRARMYAGAANTTFADSRAQRFSLPPMPFQPAQGTRCLSNCRCRWEYVQLDGDGNWDCFYRLGNAEHCPDCSARAAQANPLRIRGGVIVE